MQNIGPYPEAEVEASIHWLCPQSTVLGLGLGLGLGLDLDVRATTLSFNPKAEVKRLTSTPRQSFSLRAEVRRSRQRP